MWRLLPDAPQRTEENRIVRYCAASLMNDAPVAPLSTLIRNNAAAPLALLPCSVFPPSRDLSAALYYVLASIRISLPSCRLERRKSVRVGLDVTTVGEPPARAQLQHFRGRSNEGREGSLLEGRLGVLLDAGRRYVVCKFTRLMIGLGLRYIPRRVA